MVRKKAAAWLALLAGAGMSVGCQSGAERHCYSDDPVLLSKKPVDGPPDATPAAPVLLAHAEPVEPAMPGTIVTAAAQASLRENPVAPAVVATNVHADIEGAPVLKAVANSRPAEEPAPQMAAERHVDGLYGHAADYRWLQGVLDKHYLGYMMLRYCDASADDRWGGKVILDEDPRLAALHDGDVVQVVGELTNAANPAAEQAWEHYPHYRFRVIELIKRGGQ